MTVLDDYVASLNVAELAQSLLEGLQPWGVRREGNGGEVADARHFGLLRSHEGCRQGEDECNECMDRETHNGFPQMWIQVIELTHSDAERAGKQMIAIVLEQGISIRSQGG